MLPIPSPNCLAVIAGLVALIVIGIATGDGALVVFAAPGFLLVGVAYAATFPLARRARLQRLEFAWWLGSRAPGSTTIFVPGSSIELRCFLRHRGPRAINVSELHPIVPNAIKSTPRLGGSLTLGPSDRLDLEVRLEARAAGRFIAHGVAARVNGPFGLFGVPIYFPHPLSIQVLPRSARRMALPASRSTAILAGARAGRGAHRRRGSGMDVRELRDLVPGDPFKAIAWKTSARIGKLVVREVDQESEELHWVLLDVGPTMRRGRLGDRAIDIGLEAAVAIGLRCLEMGDRVSAVTFDRRIVGQLAPGEGKTHLLRLFELLLSTTDVVDEDLTEADDSMVAGFAARYLRHQMAIDFRMAKEGGPIPHELVRHIRSMIGDDLGAVRAGTLDARYLRRFCQIHGLSIPYRREITDEEKMKALLECLSIPQKPGTVPSRITVLSDGVGISASEALVGRLAALRAHGHIVQFILLRPPPEDRTHASRVEEHLGAVHRAHEERSMLELRRALARCGVVAAIQADASSRHEVAA